MSFSTSHRSKGGEWRAVELLDDFFEIDVLSGEEVLGIKESAELSEEINLIYVALTRASELNSYNRDLVKWFARGETSPNKRYSH
jgi:superfamily I DNA/RNA helicase